MPSVTSPESLRHFDNSTAVSDDSFIIFVFKRLALKAIYIYAQKHSTHAMLSGRSKPEGPG